MTAPLRGGGAAVTTPGRRLDSRRGWTNTRSRSTLDRVPLLAGVPVTAELVRELATRVDEPTAG
jgi:hypothetical protein